MKFQVNSALSLKQICIIKESDRLLLKRNKLVIDRYRLKNHDVNYSARILAKVICEFLLSKPEDEDFYITNEEKSQQNKFDPYEDYASYNNFQTSRRFLESPTEYV